MTTIVCKSSDICNIWFLAQPVAGKIRCIGDCQLNVYCPKEFGATCPTIDNFYIAPTMEPTLEPTADPTIEPTTQKPSRMATKYPTKQPLEHFVTATPIEKSSLPSLYPSTLSPTKRPTKAPVAFVVETTATSPNENIILTTSQPSSAPTDSDTYGPDPDSISISSLMFWSFIMVLFVCVCFLSFFYYRQRKNKIASAKQNEGDDKRQTRIEMALDKQKSASVADFIAERKETEDLYAMGEDMDACFVTNDLVRMKSEDLYADDANMTVTPSSEEGLANKFAMVESILKQAEPDDYLQYLDNFKKQKVDDVRLDKWKNTTSRDDDIWKGLIDAAGPRKDFLDVLFASADV